jgi:hypothetical protein
MAPDHRLMLCGICFHSGNTNLLHSRLGKAILDEDGDVGALPRRKQVWSQQKRWGKELRGLEL